MKYPIGKVISVSGERIVVYLTECDDEHEQSGVPYTMYITAAASDESSPCTLLIGQPGSFVAIEIPDGKLLCMVSEIDMKDHKKAIISSESSDELSDEFELENYLRLITCIPIGTVDSQGSFERGCNVLPTVNSDTFAVLPDTVNTIYKSYAEGNFTIGSLSLVPEQDACINIDAFLSRHAAILGQTGGGKSWTVATILQKIACLPQATTVLLDLHGEYATAFSADDANVISVDDLEFPYWLMNCEELLGLMIDRSEAAAPNQVAKFKELLQQAKDTPENQELGIKKITVDTPVYFNFQEILNKFQSLDTQMVQGQTKPIKGPLYGDFTRLLMRINSRLNDKRYDLILNPKKYTTSQSMEGLFRQLIGKMNERNKKITVLDISSIPFDVRNSVISLIMRCIFDFTYWYRRKNNAIFPIAVFCDEAHSYLNDKDPLSLPSRVSAERIAKEGRKYGISITIISQRPREVSATILSQCGSFLCLRMTNPDDQSYIKNLMPDNIRGIVSIFQTLRRGECILLGDSVIMPTRIQIFRPTPHPKSNDAKFSEIWNSEPSNIDVGAVLHAWRNQGIM